jgi:RimJ/RimL family protein N-acetyltransferase
MAGPGPGRRAGGSPRLSVVTSVSYTPSTFHFAPFFVASFERDGKREVCYWLGQDFWNKGIATKALSAFLQLEKRRPRWAGVAKRNAASIRVLEKCGFVLSGEETYSNRLGEKVDGLILKLAEPS